jgi:hypothetical protein
MAMSNLAIISCLLYKQDKNIMQRWGLIIGILCIFSLPVSAQETTVRAFDIVGLSAYHVPLYDKFEVILSLDADFDNPYDPDEIRVDAQFISPSGEVKIVPSFYYRSFDYSLAGDEQHLGWLEEWSWRVRFTPTEVGEWEFTVSASTLSDTLTTESQTFIATPSDNHGFVRVSQDNPRYLAFDDNTFYFPIGLNMAWYGERRMLDYRDWLSALDESGGNYMRMWLIHYGFGFEWLDTGLGTYGGRQDRMFELDVLLDMLAERDIYTMLTFLTHTSFSLEVDSQWGSNPYNVANGGMIKTPEEFVTHPEAIRLWRMQLRYIVARWGYSPNIMAWEWWNEVNWTAIANTDILVPWMEDSAAYLRELDPNNHLITHSGSTLLDASVWNMPSIDFTQDHIYYVNDWTSELSTVLRLWRFAYHKPFLLAEFGYVDPPEDDPLGIRLHLGLWQAPMTGAMGTGMFWWWDNYVHLDNHYSHFQGIVSFFAGEDLTKHDFTLTNAQITDNAKVFGLQSLDYALLWIVNKDYNDAYARNQIENEVTGIQFPTIENAQLTVSWLMGGEYHIEWWDTVSGKIISQQDINSRGRALVLDVPAFETDLALKIKSLDM